MVNNITNNNDNNIINIDNKRRIRIIRIIILKSYYAALPGEIFGCLYAKTVNANVNVYTTQRFGSYV